MFYFRNLSIIVEKNVNLGFFEENTCTIWEFNYLKETHTITYYSLLEKQPQYQDQNVRERFLIKFILKCNRCERVKIKNDVLETPVDQ